MFSFDDSDEGFDFCSCLFHGSGFVSGFCGFGSEVVVVFDDFGFILPEYGDGFPSELCFRVESGLVEDFDESVGGHVLFEFIDLDEIRRTGGGVPFAVAE